MKQEEGGEHTVATNLPRPVIDHEFTIDEEFGPSKNSQSKSELLVLLSWGQKSLELDCVTFSKTRNDGVDEEGTSFLDVDGLEGRGDRLVLIVVRVELGHPASFPIFSRQLLLQGWMELETLSKVHEN